MSTPAEIIAARVNGTYVEPEEIPVVAATKVTKASPPPTLADDLAFPTLGGSKKSVAQTATTWGPEMVAPVAAPRATPRNGATPKLSTIQDAFSLEVDDQIQAPRLEFNKILTEIKLETLTLIESSTLSLKRTFLISGKPENVKLAKRLVIKKLTKPVVVQFAVPIKIRRKIIGQGGKTLRPIIELNSVKIDIANYDGPEDESDDVFAHTVAVTIEGDVEGCKRAKAQIMAIVNEETKNMAAKVEVHESVKPFAVHVLAPTVAAYPGLDFNIPSYSLLSSKISIIGDREQVIAAKLSAEAALAGFIPKISVAQVPIPQVKHQFLPIDLILNEDQVFIKLPTGSEGQVLFIGEKHRLAGAQEKARQQTSQYKVEVLDMSRAHGGNLNHVKAVAALLRTNGTFATIGSENDVKVSAPSNKQLSLDISLIPIEIVAKNDQHDAMKKTRTQIVSTVNQITPAHAKVVTDIDAFLTHKVQGEIKQAAANNNVQVVVLGGHVYLFATENALDDDFSDSSDISARLEAVDAALEQLRQQQQQLDTVVVEVPLADHQHIRGPNQTTLNLILLAVDNDVDVKLGTPHGDAISIHGFKSDVATIKKHIETVVADAKEHGNQYTAVVTVPSAVVPRVIGRQGANLNAIRDEFGVKLDVPQPDASSDKVDIEIVGIKRNVEAAKAKLASLAKRLADETISKIKIESKYHRRMIGPNLVYLNRLQDKYNVRIQFPRVLGETSPDGPKKDEVVIKGPSKGVAKCEEELKELYAFERENGFTETLQIPTAAIARVIGRAGETIKDIADGTGVEYRFKRDKLAEEGLGYAEVELTGSKLALKEAKAKIQEIVDDVENFITVSIDVDPKYHRDLIGPSGQTMRDILTHAGADDLPRNKKYYQLLSIPNEGSGSTSVTSAGDKAIVNKVIERVQKIIAEREALVTEEVELSKEKHKLIVGPGGSIRHAIQDETGAVIDIPRPSDPSPLIKISGLPEKVAAAKAKIAELTKDDWNVELAVPAQFHHLVSERGAVFKNLQNKYGVEVVHGSSTRKASTLSKTAIPAAPEAAYPTDDVATLFSIIAGLAASDDDTTIPWRLKGSDDATAKAAEYLKSRLALAEAADHDGWFYAQNPSVFSKIIGPGGSRVSDIRQQTGTFITIPRANDKNANFVHLRGTKENLAKAQLEFTKLV